LVLLALAHVIARPSYGVVQTIGNVAIALGIPLSALLANDFFPHELRSGTESVGLQDDLDGLS